MNSDVLEVHNTTLDWLTECIINIGDLEADLTETVLAQFYAAISQETACITNILVRNMDAGLPDEYALEATDGE